MELNDSRILHDIVKKNRIGDYKSFGKTLLEGIDFVMDFTKFLLSFLTKIMKEVRTRGGGMSLTQ